MVMDGRRPSRLARSGPGSIVDVAIIVSGRDMIGDCQQIVLLKKPVRITGLPFRNWRRKRVIMFGEDSLEVCENFGTSGKLHVDWWIGWNVSGVCWKKWLKEEGKRVSYQGGKQAFLSFSRIRADAAIIRVMLTFCACSDL